MIMEEHLETLAGHVLDCDKLVTYKWLSKELQVHVNVAKQILWQFYEKYREGNNIDCTYLLIGVLKDNSMRVEVVKESSLSSAKEKFSKIISEHLYSVHKPLENLELLASSNNAGDVSYSAIKCDACIERTDEEMHRLRWGAASKIHVEENVMNSKLVESTNHKADKTQPAATKKNEFNNFFGKQKSSETAKSSETEKDKVSTEEKNNLSSDINLIEKNKDSAEKNACPKGKNKESRVNSKTKKASPKVQETKKMKKGTLENFFGKMTSPVKSTPAEVEIIEQKNDVLIVQEISKVKEVKEKEKTRGKKRNRSLKKDNDAATKRKRIMILSDSSDSEEKEESDVEMEEPMVEAEVETSARSKSPSPPTVKRENGRKKELKLVNKTYKEGEFMVTKKECVYVSCSEDEEEERKKMEKEVLKKASAKVDNLKKKQQTKLTNFFKTS